MTGGLGRRMVAAALLLGTGLVAALPGHANPAPADSRFRVEWTAAAAGPGQSRLFGYVYNDYREDAVNVQLRITELMRRASRSRASSRPLATRLPAGAGPSSTRASRAMVRRIGWRWSPSTS